jgi:hypothetical protein
LPTGKVFVAEFYGRTLSGKVITALERFFLPVDFKRPDEFCLEASRQGIQGDYEYISGFEYFFLGRILYGVQATVFENTYILENQYRFLLIYQFVKMEFSSVIDAKPEKRFVERPYHKRRILPMTKSVSCLVMAMLIAVSLLSPPI